MNVEQLSQIHKYEIPSYIEAVDARLNEKLSEDDLADLEYQFRVIYTMDTTSKSRSHFEFVRPGSEEGKEIRNVLGSCPGAWCKSVALYAAPGG